MVEESRLPLPEEDGETSEDQQALSPTTTKM